VCWDDVQRIVAAFKQAEAELKVDPILPLLNLEEFKDTEYWPLEVSKVKIKKWIWFGREEEFIVFGAPFNMLFENAINRVAEEKLEMGKAAWYAGDFLQEKLPKSGNANFWESAFDWDHNLPEQWKGDEKGPSLISPAEVARLREITKWLLAQPEVQESEYMTGHLGDLSGLLDRCGAEDGLVVVSSL
jgi:hypothetical protein